LNIEISFNSIEKELSEQQQQQQKNSQEKKKRIAIDHNITFILKRDIFSLSKSKLKKKASC
jgi:hypothetical protein